MFIIVRLNKFLSVLDAQVEGIVVEGSCVMVHVLVDTCMPVKATTNTELIYISLLGVKLIVQ